MKAVIGLLVMGVGFEALAQVVEPGTVDQAVGLLPQIFSLAMGQKYLLAGATLTLVLVFILKHYVLPKLNLGTGILPIASALIGIVSALAMGIVGGATPGQAAVALLSGPAASALWDTLLKYLFKKAEAPADQAAPPAPPQAPAA